MIAAVNRAERMEKSADAARTAVHDLMREMMAKYGRGTGHKPGVQAELMELTGYKDSQVKRIKKGETSGTPDGRKKP